MNIEPMKKEFLGMLSNLYIVALTMLLPLYTRGSYVLLGDAKYALFRNISVFCLGLAGVTALTGWLIQAVALFLRRSKSGRFQHKAQLQGLSGTFIVGDITLSPMDICMLCYGGCVLLSALCSGYGTVAWTGYQGWYMGAVSQIIFVGIYFFISRLYQGNGWPVLLWETGFFLVVLLGFCSRVGWDPLGLMRDFNSGDWEYSHLISTLGNINWFCGYCAVALAMPVAGYLKGGSLGKRIFLGAVSVLGLILLVIQGSDIGPVLVVVCLGVCLLWGRRNTAVFGRVLLLAAGIAFGLPCYSGLALLLGDNALKSLPADGPGLAVFGWGGWWLLGLVLLWLYFGIHRFAGKKQGIVNGLWLGTVILGAAVLAVGGVMYLLWLSGTEGWINGRASLWTLAFRGFLQGGWKQKLLGAGPDCFAEYIYSHFPPSELFNVEGHWAEAVFVNAHNQWLNHLINTGILGLGSAAAICVTAFRRYRCSLLGILVLCMYGVNSLVSFQQVLSTPLFFLALGLCEYSVRKRDLSVSE